MSYNTQLGSVFSLLHLKLIERDNFLYVLNLSNEELSKVTNERNGLRFDFRMNDTNYSCSYNNHFIAISNDNNESISFTGGGVFYQKKNDNSPYNKSFVILSDDLITFYQADEKGYAASLKTEYGFKRMEKSITIEDNGCLKEDIIVENVDGVPTEKHRIRKYDEEGKMLTGKLFDVTLDIKVEDYIKNELLTNPIVNDSLSQLENFIPNSVNYCSYSMPLINQLLLLIKEQKNK